MKNFIGILMVGFILFCGVSLWADDVLTYVISPDKTELNITTTNSEVETLLLEDVLFRKRSKVADLASVHTNKDSYVDNYNETVANYEAEIANLSAIAVNMTIKK